MAVVNKGKNVAKREFTCTIGCGRTLPQGTLRMTVQLGSNCDRHICWSCWCKGRYNKGNKYEVLPTETDSNNCASHTIEFTPKNTLGMYYSQVNGFEDGELTVTNAQKSGTIVKELVKLGSVSVNNKEFTDAKSYRDYVETVVYPNK